MTTPDQLEIRLTKKQLELIKDCIDARLHCYNEAPLDLAWLFNARQKIRNLIWESEGKHD